MFTNYDVELTLIRDMLGTNPCNPHVLDTHIIQKQRKMIMEKSSVNNEINKYLGQLDISKEKSDAEVNLLISHLESVIGRQFSEQEKTLAIAGELDSLKETFKELDLVGTTVFYRDPSSGMPCIGDHMILGFLKASAEALCRASQSKKRGVVLESASYTQSLINQHVRCSEPFITFDTDVVKSEDGNICYLQRSLRAMTAQGPRVALAKSEVVPKGAKLTFSLKVLEGSQITEEVLGKLLCYGELSGLGQWRNAGYGSFTYTLKRVSEKKGSGKAA